MKNNNFEEVLKWLDEEIESLKIEIETKQETLQTLQNLINELKDYKNQIGYKEKYDEVSELYKKEQERLVKLHNHYEKTKIELQGWRDWFSSNKDIFDRLFSGAPPSSLVQKPSTQATSSKSSSTKKKPKKKVKRKK